MWRNRSLWFGILIVAAVIVVALLASWISPFTPDQQNYASLLQGPSAQHWLGTDDLGRDQLTRIFFGARTSMEVTLGAVVLGIVIGVPVGLLSGFYGGVVDDWVVMRFVDALQAFPFLIMALVLAAVLGPGIGNAMIAIGIGYIPTFIRTVRGQVIAESKRDYVQSARSLGAGDWRIMVKHIFPNITSPLIVQTSLAMASGIVAEASLSYLGLGAQPPTSSWGSMLKVGQGYITNDPWLSIIPGLAIVVAVLGFNLLGDGLRDYWDPRQRQ
ncbi:MAG: diguanylate cyclase [Alicyclobacillus sp. RIFOXYA1_FULL_53_8]|nr:MAG: diguanylate cyclase [Alicyclobacillus sp. RIFOXYA1_FULL_53_8]